MTDPTDFTHKASAFRQHLPDLSTPRFITAAAQNPYEYAAAFEANAIPPQLHALVHEWRESYKEPFKGITSDGTVRSGLYTRQDEGIDIASVVRAAESLLETCSEEQRQKVQYALYDKARRQWTNPEFYLHQHGLRLEELDPTLRDSIHTILAATLSAEGYQKAVDAMRINAFLGQLVHLPQIMNEHSYNFCLFGTPSETQPWAWSLWGHHLCLCVWVCGTQMVVAPVFTGAEPNVVDECLYKGTRILGEEERLGGLLIGSLMDEGGHGEGKVGRRARIYEGMQPPEVPESRWNRDEQRHLCGAGRDNRVVPYEGVCVGSESDEEQKSLVRRILEQFLLYLPKQARKMKLGQCEEYLGETWFCWMGMAGVEDEPFYYRIQSPVIVAEFDHHSGVFLMNEKPERFHTHTILRYPNQGDYGIATTPKELIEGL